MTAHPVHALFDKATAPPDAARKAFRRARRIEDQYALNLRRIARHVDDIVKSFVPPGSEEVTPEQAAQVESTLLRYSQTIQGWAEATSRRMLLELDARDRKAWMEAAKRIGSGIAQEIASAQTGEALRKAMAEQVRLITSLPTEAGQRVHKLALEGLSTGRRASEIAKDILATGEVTRSRANLIARTESGRASAEFSKARAQSVGSTHFIWRTAGDGDVRDSHKRLNGKVFRWDQPPECDPGYHALPGAIFNCRCYPEPVLAGE